MKNRLLGILGALATVAALTGCGDDSGSSSSPPLPIPVAPVKPADLPAPVPPPTPPAPKAVTNAAAPAAAIAPAETLKAQAEKAAADTAAAAQQKFTDYVLDVQKLFAEGKTAEALQKVQNIQTALTDVKLTPEQQRLVDQLKSRTQESVVKTTTNAAAQAAAQKVSDLLTRPKPPGN